jgi:sugar O-acyltransferase (sialic acid O-acetyltransferase NeuD family)
LDRKRKFDEEAFGYHQMKPTILVGAGMHGRVVRDICRDADIQVAGFLDDFAEERSIVDDVPILGKLEKLRDEKFLSDHLFIVTIGNNYARQKYADEIERLGGWLNVSIHPSCTISPTVKIGNGTVFIGSNMVFSRAEIGKNALIDPGATIGADSRIGNSVYICPGVHTGAGVVIGDYAFLGLGAVVIPEVTIGAGAIIGAGAVVIRDIPERKLVVGNPAVVKADAVMDDFSPYPARNKQKR